MLALSIVALVLLGYAFLISFMAAVGGTDDEQGLGIVSCIIIAVAVVTISLHMAH